MFQVLDWKIFVLHCDGNVCNWIPKVIWPWMYWSRGFLFENGILRWLHIFTDRNLQQLLNCYSFCWHRFFSIFSLGGILVCCLKTILIFSHRILSDQLKSLRNANQFFFHLFVSTSSFFREVVVKFFDYSRKLNRLFSKFCLKYLLGRYLVYCSICALKDVNRAC